MGFMGNIGDSLVNFLSGLGVAGRDKSVGSYYTFIPMTAHELTTMYRGDYLSRKIVDIPAQDATREWRSWQTKNSSIEPIEECERNLQVQARVRTAKSWARLYGGSALILGFPNQDPSKELNVDNIAKGTLKFIRVCSRHQLSIGDIIPDISDPYCGQPEYYSIGGIDAKNYRIHPSRVIPFHGNPAPDFNVSGAADTFWGDPVLQSIKDAVNDATMVIQSTASLVNETKLDVIKIPELTQRIGNKDYRENLTKRFMYANASKSNINALLLDGEEEWERVNMNFGGLPDIVRIMLLIVSGAADIPATRMFGQTPVGLSSTGEADIRNYYDNIRSQQTNELTPTLSRLDDVILRNATGKREKSIYYEWNPLWQMTEAEKVAVAKTKADIFKIDVDSGIVDQEALRLGRQNQLIEDGLMPGLEEALEELDLDGEDSLLPPPKPEEIAGLLPPPTPAPVAQDGSRRKIPGLVDTRLVDAKPRPLYVYRDVLNWAEIAKYFKAQGLSTTVGNEMHVTVMYSKTAVDWMKMGDSSWGTSSDGTITVNKGGPRMMERFGLAQDAIVMLFSSSMLSYRFEEMKRQGAVPDYDEYAPHITITIDPDQMIDIESIEPYRGVIKLGPEIFEEPEDGWKDRITEDRDTIGNPHHKVKGPGGQFASREGEGGGSSTNFRNPSRQERISSRTLVPAPADKEKWPDHVKSLVLPPAWKEVHIAMDPHADLVATGLDAKGRKQYVYSQKFADSQSAVKFARISELSKKAEAIASQNAKNMASLDVSVAEHATVHNLIMETGIRPGGEDDTGADKKAYGATTLEGRHVVVGGDGSVSLQFVGKKGVDLNIPIESASTAKMLKGRAEKAGTNGRLFPNVDQGSLLEYTHTLDGGGFKTKDFRTLLGTETAKKLVSSMSAPNNIAQYKKFVKSVAVAVSKKLGNTPTVALQSYIAPFVFGPWREAAGV